MPHLGTRSARLTVRKAAISCPSTKFSIPQHLMPMDLSSWYANTRHDLSALVLMRPPQASPVSAWQLDVIAHPSHTKSQLSCACPSPVPALAPSSGSLRMVSLAYHQRMSPPKESVPVRHPFCHSSHIHLVRAPKVRRITLRPPPTHPKVHGDSGAKRAAPLGGRIRRRYTNSRNGTPHTFMEPPSSPAT